MKIAFVGKGGSGKTTLAALLARRLAVAGAPLLAIDADINQHLAAALGWGADEGASTRTAAREDRSCEQEMAQLLLPALGDRLPEIKEYLRGTNPRISSAAAMVKTTPPGRGSRLLRVGESNPVWESCVRVVSAETAACGDRGREHDVTVGGVPLAVTGPFATEDLGVACYHSKVGAVELLLNHLVDGPGEYVVVDMTAGADSFASGLFTRFDLTFLVCEPTARSVGVYRQYVGYARDFGVAVRVVGNKVEDASDVDFLRDHVGDDLLCWLGRSAYIKASERGAHRCMTELEPANLAALDALREAADARTKDWATYTRQAVEFHLRNATAWANERTGEDLAGQIDPDFVLGPAAMAAVPE